MFEIKENGVDATVKVILHSSLDHRQVHRILDVEDVLVVDGRVDRVVERLGDGQRHDGLKRLDDALTLRVPADRVPLFGARDVETGLQLLRGHFGAVFHLGRVAVQSFQIPGTQVLFLVVVPVNVDGQEGRLFGAFVVLDLLNGALPPLVVDLAPDSVT